MATSKKAPETGRLGFRRIKHSRLREKSIGFFREYHVMVETDFTTEELTKPEAWADFKVLRAMDKIEVCWDDGSRRAILTVLAVGTGFAKVKILHDYPDLKEGLPEGMQADKLFVDWQGPHCKYSVLRKSDKVRVKEGFENRIDAERWALDHNKIAA